MKMTLLEMVQDILSDMSSDTINSFDDTEEGLQVAQIIKTTYHEMMTRRDWPHLKKVRTLESYNDNSRPMYLRMPTDARKIEWLAYDQRIADNENTGYSQLKWLDSADFIQLLNSRSVLNSNVSTFLTEEGVPLRIITDRPPSYYTSFDDNLIILDSFVSYFETTVQGIHSQTEMYIYPSWEDTNEFIPSMPAHLFPALLAEAKSTCFLVLKKMENLKAEQISKRQQYAMSYQGWRTKGGISYPNYGRNRNGR